MIWPLRIRIAIGPCRAGWEALYDRRMLRRTSISGFATLVAVVTMTLAACGGSSGADPVAAGRTIYGDHCSSCHGATGGGQVGPSFDDVLAIWPSCADQIEWVSLGSDGWEAAHGSAYGAQGTPVAGGMPGWKDTLQPEEIAEVVAFERVQYGGGDRASVLADCDVSGG
jgi:mono/diheme cytochrome c family protein